MLHCASNAGCCLGSVEMRCDQEFAGNIWKYSVCLKHQEITCTMLHLGLYSINSMYIYYIRIYNIIYIYICMGVEQFYLPVGPVSNFAPFYVLIKNYTEF